MRCQLCFRLVESSAMKLRATSFQRVYVVKNMICNVANDYGFRRLRKVLYVDKIVHFNFDSCSVLKKLEATQCFTVFRNPFLVFLNKHILRSTLKNDCSLPKVLWQMHEEWIKSDAWNISHSLGVLYFYCFWCLKNLDFFWVTFLAAGLFLGFP